MSGDRTPAITNARLSRTRENHCALPNPGILPQLQTSPVEEAKNEVEGTGDLLLSFGTGEPACFRPNFLHQTKWSVHVSSHISLISPLLRVFFVRWSSFNVIHVFIHPRP